MFRMENIRADLSSVKDVESMERFNAKYCGAAVAAPSEFTPGHFSFTVYEDYLIDYDPPPGDLVRIHPKP